MPLVGPVPLTRPPIRLPICSFIVVHSPSPIMQSGHSSGPSFSNPTRSIYFSRPALDPLLEEDFYITREDLEILAEYIDEFQDADAEMWTTIVANAMAELAIL